MGITLRKIVAALAAILLTLALTAVAATATQRDRNPGVVSPVSPQPVITQTQGHERPGEPVIVTPPVEPKPVVPKPEARPRPATPGVTPPVKPKPVVTPDPVVLPTAVPAGEL